jgi:hypothetical protein
VNTTQYNTQDEEEEKNVRDKSGIRGKRGREERRSSSTGRYSRKTKLD